MKLTELFDKFDLSKANTFASSDEYVVNTIIGDNRIEFGATKSPARNTNRWNIDFHSSDSDEYRTYSMTNAGNQFEVMQFVMTCVRNFIEKYDPDVIIFSASKTEKSRVNVYDRLIKRFGKDYVVKKVNTEREDKTYLHKRSVDKIEEAREFSNSELGELSYGWKSKKDLCDEEDTKKYIPDGYDKVLELGGIFAAEPGKGQGDKLMKQFLDSPEAGKADLIFCDPVPGLGSNFKSDMSEAEQVEKLMKFYRRYGFRNNPKSHRMWLVKKGSISDNKLPT